MSTSLPPTSPASGPSPTSARTSATAADSLGAGSVSGNRSGTGDSSGTGDRAGLGELSRRDMFAAIKQLCVPNNQTNWWVLVREYAVLFAVAVGCTSFYHWLVAEGHSLWWAVLAYGVSVIVIGVWMQNRLACLVHEASHYSLFKNRILNDVVANLLVTFPFFGTISNYRIGHWGHHRHVNNPDLDPDLHRLISHQPRDFPIPKWKFWRDYVLLQTLPHKAYSYLKGRALYVARRMKSTPVRDQDALGRRIVAPLRLGYYAALIGLLAWTGWWAHYALFWLVPMITFYPATLFLREIAHHGNYPDNGDYTNSRVYEGYWLEREIFVPFSEQNHVLHHMFPTIPWHQMRRAHDVMMRYPPYRDNVVICDGFFFKSDATNTHPTVLDVLEAPSRHYLNPNSGQQSEETIRSSTADEIGDAPISTSPLGGES